MRSAFVGRALTVFQRLMTALERVSAPGLLFTAAAFLLLTLFPWMPLNPFAASRFEEVPGGGISFEKPSLFRSAWAPDFARSAAMREGRLSVEFDVLPTFFEQDESSRILSYSADEANPIFTIAQRRGDLLLGYKNDSNYVLGLFESNVRHHYVLVLEGGRVHVYVDGAHWRTEPFYGKDIPWGEGFISLANEITGDRPFVGNIYGLRLFDRPLTPTEASGLFRREVPPVPHLALRHDVNGQKLTFVGSGLADLPLEVEAWPFIWKWRLPLPAPVTNAQYWLDVVLNVIATMPVGAWGLAWLLRRGRPAWQGILMASGFQFVLSLLAEASQFFSMGFRFGSWLDVVVNVSGAVLGGVLWLGLTRGLARSEGTR
ncbi:MAG: LamG-like jellyroll fold domain-containing protein [Polyangiaceae bacterium]|nr:LamG-like jellyroll fold domain-containing protein [Polyangiaceae bacterium]